MKKLLALLLCLLMVAQFVPASAETVQEVFTAGNISVFGSLEQKGNHFTLEIRAQNNQDVQGAYGFVIGRFGSHAVLTIKAANGYIIDEVCLVPGYVGGLSDGIQASSGTPSPLIFVRAGEPSNVTNINAPEVSFFETDGESYVDIASITVIGHGSDAPATGDATPIALLGCALVVSAFALAEIRRRRVHA